MLKVFKSVRATVAHYWPIFRAGGPVALGQAVRQAHIDRKIKKAYDLIDREEALHDRMVSGLRADLNHWLGQQHAVAVAQDHFNRFVSKTNPGSGVQP